MAWTTPATYATNEVLASSKLNTHVRDNLRYLKGLDGDTNLGASLTVDGGTVRSGSGAGAYTDYTASSINHAGSDGLNRIEVFGQNRAAVVNRISQRVHHAPNQGRPDGHLHNAPGALYQIAFFDLLKVTE